VTNTKKIGIQSKHMQFANCNMRPLQDKFEKLDKLSHRDRAGSAGSEQSNYFKSSLIENASVVTQKQNSIAIFSSSHDESSSSGLVHMKAGATGDLEKYENILVSLIVLR